MAVASIIRLLSFITLLWLAQNVATADTLIESPSAFVLTCKAIAHSISNASSVYWPPSANYSLDVEHWANSSSQASACSVEPGSAADVGVILQILGGSRTPFAVKGGGHASNPGFSSTEGVHISMSRFNQITYDAVSSTVVVGAGLLWDDVYAALEPFDVNVVGGRAPGIGVAGFTLGGGYSFKTNQYGPIIDTVLAFELVLPNGKVTKVTASSNPDLFFGLRGGFNNFGIVTKFTLKAFPQTQVWGGLITYLGDKNPALALATSNFATNVTDPKASIVTAFNAYMGQPITAVLVFYDGPTPPSGIFDELLAIDSAVKDISTRSFLDLLRTSPPYSHNLRAAFHTVSLVELSPSLMNIIVNETLFWASKLSTVDNNTFVSYDAEPFLPSLLTHGSGSAYPPDRSRGLLPFNIYYGWNLPTADNAFLAAIKKSIDAIAAAANAEGQNIGDAALYGNYAVAGTPLSKIYGANVPRLRAIKTRYDPQNVMGLAGGWKF